MTWGREPPPPPNVYRGCLRKEALAEWEARLKARRLRARYYQCPDCGRWHVTRGVRMTTTLTIHEHGCEWRHRVATDAPRACVCCGAELVSGAKVLRRADGEEYCRGCGVRYAEAARNSRQTAGGGM